MPRERRTDAISHRGANGYIPEHTIAAYSLAIDLKADYIEPDLVLSSDGVFFAMHDILLDNMTNISGRNSLISFVMMLYTCICE
jgi:glycerophosphoryl diester phosphodiesterase